MTAWQTWVRQPQQLWLRRALFQVHLWTGIATGLYVLVVCLTGSVIVYRNELYKVASPTPMTFQSTGNRLTDDELTAAAIRAFPGYRVTHIFHSKVRSHAVDIWMERGADAKKRLFQPYTGIDLGDSVPVAIRFVSSLVDLHDNLLGGPTGRIINGLGGVLTVVLAFTGLVVWWPGVPTWRRSLTMRRKVGWKRVNWDLHSVLGFWGLAVVILFGVTGAYLGFPGIFSTAADMIEPPTDTNAGTRTVDQVLYWLARLHFGRFGGSATKMIWAVAGLLPIALFVTGFLMWWNRVLSPRIRPQLSEKAIPDRANANPQVTA